MIEKHFGEFLGAFQRHTFVGVAFTWCIFGVYLSTEQCILSHARNEMMLLQPYVYTVVYFRRNQ
jgi:hypothetical protein